MSFHFCLGLLAKAKIRKIENVAIYELARGESWPLSLSTKRPLCRQHIVWAEFVPLWLTSTAGHPPCSICASAQPRLFTCMKSLQNKPQNPWPWPIFNKHSWGQEDTHGSTGSDLLKVSPITDELLDKGCSHLYNRKHSNKHWYWVSQNTKIYHF